MGEHEFRALVGMDWGDASHEVAIWDEQTQTQTSEAIEQTPAALRAWVASLRERFGGGPVAVAIEQSRGAVFEALNGHSFLALYPINPRSAARYREAFHPSRSKDDPTDADSLLDLVHKHRDKLRRFVPDDRSTRLLRLLTEDRRELVDQRTQHVQRLTDRLKTYYPQALRWAGHLITAQACDFLDRWPTLQAIQSARPSTIRSFYRRHFHAARWIDQRLAAIRAEVSLHDDPVTTSAAVMLIHSEVAQIRALSASIAKYDEQIALVFATHQDAAIFTSFPGAGAQLAPRLAAAFGTNRDRFDSAASVAAQSGIAPVLRRSGSSFTRGHTHHEAIRTLAYRWIRILYACWKDHSVYDETPYLRQLAQRGSSLATAAA